MRSNFYLTIVLLWIIPLNCFASLKVLLCAEGFTVKNKEGIIQEVLPGDTLGDGSRLQASTYPAYIALYHSSGKFLETSIFKPMTKDDLEFLLKKSIKTPFASSLIEHSLKSQREAANHAYKTVNLKHQDYHSLSHLKTSGPLRCPSPAYEILGAEKIKVEPRVYSLSLYSRRPYEEEIILTFKTTNMGDQILETKELKSSAIQEGIKLDLTQPLYKEMNLVLLHLKSKISHREECDTKLIELLSAEEAALKNADVKKLQREFPDKTSILGNYLMAMVLEDHQMYLDSVELFMSVYQLLRGKDRKHGDRLYNYLLSGYRFYEL